MPITRRPLHHDGPGGRFAGVFAWDDSIAGPRPGVLVVPNILGQKEADNAKAEALAALGYAAYACDLYGEGRRAEPGPDIARYMDELNADRALLRDRLAASLAALVAQPEVEAARTAAIGFCFGGKCVLDMARAGLEVRGVVSFHGVYDRPDYASVAPITAKVLVCHGWDDPLGPPEAVTALAQELTEARADWQIHAYGNAGHAFTDEARRGSTVPGVAYEERADRRSWAAMRYFLEEALG
ncbi:dienelactone hydrolase family protein [Sphingomonas sp. BK069]|uniref:dienelactone hydrolase family protein n=1 Tax=Sphingomonas sp. BK069 TaxID=2586979 RepID=UPI00161C6559|nr:dienelactone hydrolase family protein [Sphingomonas sp. BK069]MBB3348670.1 dienelactone hydrolase [Sphingomonas sp. BK069]